MKWLLHKLELWGFYVPPTLMTYDDLVQRATALQHTDKAPDLTITQMRSATSAILRAKSELHSEGLDVSQLHKKY